MARREGHHRRAESAVVRLILGLAAKLGTLAGIRLHPTLVNGLPGYVFYDSSGPFQTLALETRDDGKIAAIYVVRNPDKLRHLPAFSPA